MSQKFKQLDLPSDARGMRFNPPIPMDVSRPKYRPLFKTWQGVAVFALCLGLTQGALITLGVLYLSKGLK